MPNKKVIIQESLSTFLQRHNAEPPEGAIDDIVLDYVVSILEEIGSEEDVQDSFDVEGFSEMMEAYIPGFACIESTLVTEWIFLLTEKLKTSESLSNGINCTVIRHSEFEIL
ncbi:hypothetical protein CAPTEDRAFT_204159 [Capitella teleta]|uniref:CUE domain-containing protein n=1 Tax=Capitella teleta TaxID=283909 RepID=R7V4M3_CAPTE|nr:hypothetical protein CAPTEDRAFT_204159 [Capitella teleta]|eukprot:ELU13793.1 hypothetical protein CAPTEDRAFT_204159 [Capitella teleta]